MAIEKINYRVLGDGHVRIEPVCPDGIVVASAFACVVTSDRHQRPPANAVTKIEALEGDVLGESNISGLLFTADSGNIELRFHRGNALPWMHLVVVLPDGRRIPSPPLRALQAA